MTMPSLSMTGASTGGQCSLRRPCQPCPEGSRRTHTFLPSLVEHSWVALNQRGRIPKGSTQPSLRRLRRVGSYGNSRPIADQENRSTQGLGGEDRITHSTLHRWVPAASEDPQNSAILGSRRTSRGIRKAHLAMGARRQGILERTYINHLRPRSMALPTKRGRV